MSSPAHKKEIWNLIKDIKVGMLITRDGDDMRGRPMYIVQDDYDGVLWFFTDLDEEKMQEVQEDHHVCVTFSDPDNHTYVSLTGAARVQRDQKLIDKFWSPFVSAWFPQGKEAPNVGLIEIKVRAGEHWNSDASSIKYFLEIGKANIVDKKPDLGENEKFGKI